MSPVGNRIPKKGDIVTSYPLNANFVVIAVDYAAKMVKIQPLDAGEKVKVLEFGVPWMTLTYVDERDGNQKIS